jgi:hypothetical protein
MADRGVIITYDAGELVLDAAPSQRHQHDVDVTEHPVELGAAVTDHVRPKPRVLQVEGVFVDATTWATLNRLAEGATLLTVTTVLETYENMVLSSLSAPRDASTGDVLRFSATFRRIVFAESQRVTIRIPKAKTARGKQPSSAASAEAAAAASEKRQSYLSVFSDFVGRRRR